MAAQSLNDNKTDTDHEFLKVLREAEIITLEEKKSELRRQIKADHYLHQLRVGGAITRKDERKIDDLSGDSEKIKKLVDLLIRKHKELAPSAKKSPFDVLAELLVEKRRGPLADELYQEREAQCARLIAEKRGLSQGKADSDDEDVNVCPGETHYFREEDVTNEQQSGFADSDNEQPPSD